MPDERLRRFTGHKSVEGLAAYQKFNNKDDAIFSICMNANMAGLNYSMEDISKEYNQQVQPSVPVSEVVKAFLDKRPAALLPPGASPCAALPSAAASPAFAALPKPTTVAAATPELPASSAPPKPAALPKPAIAALLATPFGPSAAEVPTAPAALSAGGPVALSTVLASAVQPAEAVAAVVAIMPSVAAAAAVLPGGAFARAGLGPSAAIRASATAMDAASMVEPPDVQEVCTVEQPASPVPACGFKRPAAVLESVPVERMPVGEDPTAQLLGVPCVASKRACVLVGAGSERAQVSLSRGSALSDVTNVGVQGWNGERGALVKELVFGMMEFASKLL